MPTIEYQDFNGRTQKLEYFEKTVEEAYNALVQNGFDYLRGEWFSYKDGIIIGACILGQAAINLHANANGSEYPDGYEVAGLYRKLDIIRDPKGEARMTLEEQLNRFRVRKNSKWNLSGIEGSAIGSTIIHWNDATEYDDMNKARYVLDTYEKVAQMAKAVMRPHFKRIIYLMNEEYNVGKELGGSNV